MRHDRAPGARAQNALARELGKAGLVVECQRAIAVSYDGVAVGSFVVDMLVAGVVLVENKAVRSLAPGHEVQLVNYLTATGIEIGLILNFGTERLQFKRKTRTPRPGQARETARQDGQDEQD